LQEEQPETSHEPDLAAEELFASVYDELHGLARRQMSRQSAGHTLQATALVNEVYLKLSSRMKQAGDGAAWDSREHFLGLASRAMRSILVDHARKKGSQKRSAEGERVALDSAVHEVEASAGDILALDDALELLAKTDRRMASLVELCFFGGCSMEDAAKALGMSTRTAQREWRLAKAKLRKELGDV